MLGLRTRNIETQLPDVGTLNEGIMPPATIDAGTAIFCRHPQTDIVTIQIEKGLKPTYTLSRDSFERWLQIVLRFREFTELRMNHLMDRLWNFFSLRFDFGSLQFETLYDWRKLDGEGNVHWDPLEVIEESQALQIYGEEFSYDDYDPID